MEHHGGMMWNWRVIIVVPAASKAAAEQAARSINSTGPDYSGDAFCSPLSISGSLPATHWGLYTSATDSIVDAMALALPSISGVQFWRHNVAGSLVASNVTDAAGQAWGYQDSLEASGLRQCPAAIVP
jgi:hypothetical protein